MQVRHDPQAHDSGPSLNLGFVVADQGVIFL
jgi:hypothetical protein